MIAVKSIRIWLLLLLAVLLPIRSALAVAMPCAALGDAGQVQAQVAEHTHGDPLPQAGPPHHEASAHDHPDAAIHEHGAAADKCNICFASCSASGLVGGPMTLAEPQPVAAVFPHLYAPPPSFLSDGQERPPRSI